MAVPPLPTLPPTPLLLATAVPPWLWPRCVWWGWVAVIEGEWGRAADLNAKPLSTSTALPSPCRPSTPHPALRQATARAAAGGVAIANSVATALSFGGGFAAAYSTALAQAFSSNPAPLCAALATADATAIAAGKGSIATAAANALALCPHSEWVAGGWVVQARCHVCCEPGPSAPLLP